MFDKEKTFFFIKKETDHEVCFETLDERLVQRKLDEFQKIWDTNISFTKYFYSGEAIKGKTKRTLCTIRDLVLKTDIEKLKFVNADKKLFGLFCLFDIKYYCVRIGELSKDYYISQEDNDFLEGLIKTEQSPLVIKGTDKPYWFKIGGKLIPSETPSWYKFLYDNYKIIRPEMLESYDSPDKHDSDYR